MKSVRDILEQMDTVFENLRTNKLDLKDAVELNNNAGKRLNGHKMLLEYVMHKSKHPNAEKLSSFEK